MLTLITPCSRPTHLPKLYESIQFDKIDRWIIVYDTSKDRTYEKQFVGHPKILELEYNGGISGNPQRNHAIDQVTDGYVYFLDDDNIIHPAFWSIADMCDGEHFYTFDQLRDNRHTILRGNRVSVGFIDTAMYIVHRKHIANIRWINSKYDADGHFICEIRRDNPGKHTYVNRVGAYYNYISSPPT
jgi:glycosyltransferase involved in cell wall biosynthesis